MGAVSKVPQIVYKFNEKFFEISKKNSIFQVTTLIKLCTWTNEKIQRLSSKSDHVFATQFGGTDSP